MNGRQRAADSDMRYLGMAWRLGFSGPRERPLSTTLWQQIRQQIRDIPPEVDSERVWGLHARWLRVADHDQYAAAILKLHYRDSYRFKDNEILAALDRFSLA